MKLLILITIAILFSACNIGETPKELEAKRAQENKIIEAKLANLKEIQLKQIDAKTELEKQKLMLQEKKEKALLAIKMMQLQHNNSTEMQKYILIMAFVFLAIISFFVFYYFKKRHENKLRAYQDNLEKYFHQQENMTKMRIAEKIIDTVADGKLDKAQGNELIKALSGNIAPEQEPKLLNHSATEDTEIL